jgi:hypothetical protein
MVIYLSGEILEHIVGEDLIALSEVALHVVMRLAPIGRSDPNYRMDQPMRGYLSGELLQHMVGVDLIPLPEVPLGPAFLLLLPAGLALASQLPVRLAHLVLHPSLLLHSSTNTVANSLQDFSARDGNHKE